MKQIFRIKLLLIVGLTVFLGNIGWGQNSCFLQLQDVIALDNAGQLPKTYASWDWKLLPTDQNYCKTWVARTTSNGIQNMGAPWYQPGNSILTEIGSQEDYQPNDGWVIIKRDFGLLSAQVPNPYFILYNKFRGLMRVFVYVMDENSYDGAIMTLEVKNTSGTYQPGLASLASPKLMAADKFLSSNQNDLDNVGQLMLTSVTEYGGGGGQWVMGEFNPQFDPNFSNGNFTNSTFEIVVTGIQTNTITQEGTTEVLEKGYSFTLQKKNTNTQNQLQKFFAKSSKLTKDLKGQQKVFQNIAKNAKNVKDFANSKSLSWLASSAGSVNALFGSSDASKIFKSITSTVGVVDGIFSTIGTIVGLFTKDKKKTSSSKVETFSTNRSSGTIKLNGTIEGRRVVDQFTVKIPGTPHVGASVNEPYYDCPLGLVNLKTTPVLDSNFHSREISQIGKLQSIPIGQGGGVIIPESQYTNFVSYKGNKDLEVTHNAGAGLEVISAQVAIVGQVRRVLKSEIPDPNNPGETIKAYGAAYNLFLASDYTESPLSNSNQKFYDLVFNYPEFQLSGNRYLVTNIDPDSGFHVFQTKFVDIGCFKDLSFNVPAETDVHIRLKVVLKDINDTEDDYSSILYIQDYRVDVVNKTATPLTQVSITQLPPYDNLTTLPAIGLEVKQVIDLNNQTFTSPSDNGANPLALTTLNVENVVINNVNNGEITFRSNQEIIIKPGFDVTLGSTFRAKIEDFGYNINCNDLVSQGLAVGCEAINSTAIRSTESQVTIPTQRVISQLFNAYPNPTNGQVTINYQVGTGGGKVHIYLSDVNARMMKILVNAQVDNQGMYKVTFDTNNLKPGVYFYTLQIDDYMEVRRLVVTK
ncbi:hypothetical protein BKI52_27260 [marine bacterium AO1-C]|nr:hypothetical protein BKI52_27260 [marine bacterium AO1-C]